MPDSENSKDTNVTQLPNASMPHVYDVDALDDFLSIVFHTELYDDDRILCWITPGTPGLPKSSEEEFFKILRRSGTARKLYFGTSTCKPDPRDGTLHSSKALFTGLHVVVLDDIGTKVPIDILPVDLEPTYIIESSEGNYQYGFVLEEPVRVLEHAQALIQLVYDSGFTDAGGSLATKLVRLPDGVNGKPGEKGKFHVKLIKDDGPYWTPDDLLDVLELDTTWTEVLDDADKALKQRPRAHVGLNQWSPIKLESPNLTGLVDPVVEWLYKRGMVNQETNDWVDILCPWADEHTDKLADRGDLAGYSPLGRGDELHAHLRGFHCFHSHCKTHKAGDFLKWVAANNGPEVAIEEHAAELVARYAYDAPNDCVWDMDAPMPTPLRRTAFMGRHPRKVTVYHANGDTKQVAEHVLWLNADNRVEVFGRIFDPSSNSKLVLDSHKQLMVNTFNPPDWGGGDYDQKHVDRFTAYLKYLIPDEESYDYYLEWLSAKAQDLGFRGAGIIMIAGAFGTGRTTLSDMLQALFGHQNVENVPFSKVTGGGEFNDWLTKPLIISDETLSIGKEANFYKVFEGLKDIVDTTAKMTRINPKFGKQFQQKIHASFMFFSNHQNAMAIARGDRRFYVLDNPDVAESDQYFEDLHVWIDELDEGGRPVWARHVWRWLQTLEVDLKKLHAPAKQTEAKQRMEDATKSPTRVAVEAVLAALPCSITTHHQVAEILQPLHPRLHLDDMAKARRALKAALSELTLSSPEKRRIDGNPVHLKINPTRATAWERAEFMKADRHFEAQDALDKAVELVKDTDLKAVRLAVEAALDLHDL